MAYWSVLILAVYSITEFFGGYKYFKAGHVVQGYLMNSLWLSVFIASMFFLAYRIYSEERAKNNIRAEFWLFEKLHVILNPAKASGYKGSEEILMVTALPQGDRRNK